MTTNQISRSMSTMKLNSSSVYIRSPRSYPRVLLCTMLKHDNQFFLKPQSLLVVLAASWSFINRSPPWATGCDAVLLKLSHSGGWYPGQRQLASEVKGKFNIKITLQLLCISGITEKDSFLLSCSNSIDTHIVAFLVIYFVEVEMKLFLLIIIRSCFDHVCYKNCE